jgi:ectoine hydroxylase-related dioxygenase (phytanoyl-CoA dioxygenase family)
MLELEIVSPSHIEQAAQIFHRDGFVAIENALTDEQFGIIKEAAHRVVVEQTQAIALEKANRGYARYSFGSQTHHLEWAMLIDLPTILPIVEKIFDSNQFVSSGGGGDYSLPGAKIQHLHADMPDHIKDPQQRVTIMDLPTPFIVVNFPMIDFSKENGATRFIKGTHRSRHPIPKLDEEPEWMKNAIACAPAQSAIIRDVRCWHGGTPNTSQDTRIMTSTGYYAPWFRRPGMSGDMPRAIYNTLSERAKELCRFIVSLEEPTQ